MSEKDTIQPPSRRGLSRKRQEAALAIVTCPTVRAAAASIGISEVTLYRWLRDESFRVLVSASRKQVMDATVNRLVATSLNAVEVLHSVANDSTAEHSAKVSASRALLQYSIQAGLISELESRLQQLEGNNEDT